MRLCINVFVCSLFVVFVSCKSGNKPETTRQVKNEGNLEKNVFKNSNKLPKKDDSEYPILEFLSRNTFDFGVVNDDTLISNTFYFCNIGNYPLVILDYFANCQCTSLIIDKNYILPNDTASVTMELSAKNKIGKTRISAKLVTNTELKYYKIVMHGDIISTVQ